MRQQNTYDSQSFAARDRWGRRRVLGFSLIELLLVVAIIGLLASLAFPSLRRAQRRVRDVSCLGQVRQISLAMSMYLDDWEERYFWHGGNLAIYGMDWYVYAGRESGNQFLGQEHPDTGISLFNRFQPRPLNEYVRRKIELFRCPFDTQPWPWSTWADTMYSHFDLVGNSYAFNATGYPITGINGLSGVRQSAIALPSQLAVFYDTTVNKAPHNWHDGMLASFAFADGHGEFTEVPGYDGDRDIFFEP